MSQKKIEFVCTGNMGRSPLAELIGREYLVKKDLNSHYNTISSGTCVDDILSENLDLSFKISKIELGKKRGIYESKELNEINKAIKNGDNYSINNYYNFAMIFFTNEEIRHRDEIIKEYGIEGKVKTNQEQTIIRNDTIAVLSMSDENNEVVKKIYEDLDEKPIIQTLGQFIGYNNQIPNHFGLGIEAYKEVFSLIKEYVPLAIDKVVENETKN